MAVAVVLFSCSCGDNQRPLQGGDAGSDGGDSSNDCSAEQCECCAACELSNPICQDLPPDPSSVAPPVSNGVATTMFDGTRFLYDGPGAVQMGVEPGTMEPARAALVRGIVRNRKGAGMPAVTVRVHGHPEYGSTQSRKDGRYDLVVNGGASVTLDFDRTGFLPAQRNVSPPWQGSAQVDDLVLVPQDDHVTRVDLGVTSGVKVARGSIVQDDRGTRRTTVLFPSGTEAMLVMANGQEVPAPALNVHVTEYTVGGSGPEAMPAPLPPSTAYTHAFEVSDEAADAQHASGIRFARPVIVYVENFLSVKIGLPVPLGYYDRSSAQWVASDNGVVVRIVDIAAGKATLSLSETGEPANAATLIQFGITDEELATLAQLYSAGQSLWRMPIPHFSTWDSNWGWGPPPDATPPSSSDPPPAGGCSPPGGNQGGNGPGASAGHGSVSCASQSVSQNIPIAGTSFSLNYDSRRVEGYAAARTIAMQVSGNMVPSSLKNITVETQIAGQTLQSVLPPAPNVVHSVVWDGKDSYGRKVLGQQTARVRVGFTYDGSRQIAPRFGYNGNGSPITADRTPRAPAGVVPDLPPITVWKDHLLDRPGVGKFDARNELQTGLGGWSISVHHHYDPVGRVLYLGTGERIERDDLPAGIRKNLSPQGGDQPADGRPVSEVSLQGFGDQGNVLALPDGNVLYVISNRIWMIRRDQTLWRFAGSAGSYTGGSDPGDGQLARDVQLHPHSVRGLSQKPDGTIVFCDIGDHRIKSVDPAGVLHVLAGTGSPGFSGDGGPAVNAALDTPEDTAIGPDGSIYVADTGNQRVRRISPDGLIFTIAGNGVARDTNDGGAAIDASLDGPGLLASAPDGTLYVATGNRGFGTGYIRKIAFDGTITTIAGGGGNTYPGAVASQVTVGSLTGMAFAHDGMLYYTQRGGYLSSSPNDYPGDNAWRIRPDGRLDIVAGGAGGLCSGTPTDIPAVSSQTCFGRLDDISVGPDGTIYLADAIFSDGYTQRNGDGLIAVKAYLPGFTGDTIVVPSPDGREQFVFDRNGRHLQTLSSLTGAMRYRFDYDDSDHLIRITDGDNRITSIDRGANGQLTGIVAPFGQWTQVTLDDRGYLASIADPTNHVISLSHDRGGLLQRITDNRGGSYAFVYDDAGRVVSTTDAAAASHALTRTTLTDSSGRFTGHEVLRIGPEGRRATYRVSHDAGGAMSYQTIDGAGVTTGSDLGLDGGSATSLTDGTLLVTARGPDPIAQATALPQSLTTITPSGRTRTWEESRSASRNGTLAVASAAIDGRLNGRRYLSTYDGAALQWTHRSPSGRTQFETIDSQERIVEKQIDGLDPIRFTYDRGLLVAIRQGSDADERLTQLSYDTRGLLQSVTDPLGRLTTYVRDDAGRVLSAILPGNRTIGFTYDGNGNVRTITPPGKPSHAFSYTAVDLVSGYLPPPVAGAPSPGTSYLYDGDRNPTMMRRPDGLQVTYHHDLANRIDRIDLPASYGVPAETISLTYTPTTGQLATLEHSGGVSIANHYDGSLVTSETISGIAPTPIVLSRGFDSDFRMISESLNNSLPVSFGYDTDSLLTAVGDLTLTRDPRSGLVTGATLGVLGESWGYNGFAEQTSYVAQVGSTEILRTGFTRDKLGRITEKVETVDGVTSVYDYHYDTAGRLEAVDKDGAQISDYAYDDNGNRINASTTFPIPRSILASYDDQDRLMNYGGAMFTYTDNGELRTRTENGETTTYAYDAMGNLRLVTLPDGTLVEYLVDGRGRRTGKRVNGTLVQAFVYGSQLAPVAELDGSGNIVARFVYGARANVPEYMVRDGARYRLIIDHLGSPRLVIDVTSGAIVQQMNYDEWGIVLNDTNPGFQPFGFAGGLYDSDTGYVRFGTRDYMALFGRWTSKDPLLFAGHQADLYGYAHQEPVNRSDIYGLVESSYDIWSSDSPAHGSVVQSVDWGSESTIGPTGLAQPIPEIHVPTPPSLGVDLDELYREALYASMDFLGGVDEKPDAGFPANAIAGGLERAVSVCTAWSRYRTAVVQTAPRRSPPSIRAPHRWTY